MRSTGERVLSKLGRQLAMYDDDQPRTQLSRIPFPARDHPSRRLALSSLLSLSLRLEVGNREQQLVVVLPNSSSELLHSVTNRLGEFLEGSVS